MAKREMKTKNTEAPVEEVVTPEVQEEKTEVTGIVVGCKKLNVRKEAKQDGEILGTIPVDAKVIILSVKPMKGLFHKVRTDSGLEGFCHKNYIKIEQ